MRAGSSRRFKLAEVLLPDELAHARGALASDNLELRDRFVAEVPQLTSAEIGARAGLKNGSAPSGSCRRMVGWTTRPMLQVACQVQR